MTTSKAGSFLAMAIIGGAMFALPMAFIAQRFQILAAADIVVLEAYVLIAYDSFFLSQVRATGASEALL